MPIMAFLSWGISLAAAILKILDGSELSGELKGGKMRW